MTNTSQMLRSKSEALKKSVQTILGEIKKTNDEITAQLQINESSVVQLGHDIEQLQKDNEELLVLRAENETFISKVEDIIPED